MIVEGEEDGRKGGRGKEGRKSGGSEPRMNLDA
jgi:hypothetical protein